MKYNYYSENRLQAFKSYPKLSEKYQILNSIMLH